MKHNFSNSEIILAWTGPALEADEDYPPASLDHIRAFLDALPEPATDEWQECGFNDFRPTDKRVKAVFIGGSIIEGAPDRRNHEHVFLVDGPVIHSYDDATFYRIPAPVVHPDPEVHEFILTDGMVWRANKVRTTYHCHGQMMRPEWITDWTPAKVVADDA